MDVYSLDHQPFGLAVVARIVETMLAPIKRYMKFRKPKPKFQDDLIYPDQRIFPFLSGILVEVPNHVKAVSKILETAQVVLHYVCFDNRQKMRHKHGHEYLNMLSSFG